MKGIYLALVFWGLTCCTPPKTGEGVPLGTPAFDAPPAVAIPIVDTIPIMNEVKAGMMATYYRRHYGLDSFRLDSPQMVVVHYTVIPTLKPTLNLFKRDRLSADRTYITRFSPLNVSIHYVIDRDGSIYTLMPDSLMARHIIGFNHISLGIENIAKGAAELTSEQLAANVALIRFLKYRHPSLRYLIGHYEYNDTTLAHWQHFTSLDPAYRAYAKQDPGPVFMQALRDSLATDGLYFEQ